MKDLQQLEDEMVSWMAPIVDALVTNQFLSGGTMTNSALEIAGDITRMMMDVSFCTTAEEADHLLTVIELVLATGRALDA